jgi:hypothetical protein
MLGAIVTKIKRRRELSQEIIQAFELAEQRFIELSRDDDPRTIKSIHIKCEEDVRIAIPDAALWFPAPEKRHRSQQRATLAPPIAEETTRVKELSSVGRGQVAKLT